MKKIKELWGVTIIGIILIFLLYFSAKTLLPLIDKIQNPSIPENDLISVLGILLTFISISAFGVYYTVSKAQESRLDKLENKIKNISNDEGVASRISSDLALALSFIYSHAYLYDDESKIKPFFIKEKKEEESKFIRSAIRFNRKALSRFKDLKDTKKYDKISLQAKNNLSFAISLSFFPSEKDRDDADNFSKEIYKFSKKDDKDYSYVYAATRAAVLLRLSKFGNEHDERKKASDEIYEKLLNENGFCEQAIFSVTDNDKSEIAANRDFISNILKSQQ